MTNDEIELLVAKLREQLREDIREEVEPLYDMIGRVNDKGDGGTGMAGDMARMKTKMDDLFRLKHMGAGAIIALSLTGALILYGFKNWILELAK